VKNKNKIASMQFCFNEKNLFTKGKQIFLSLHYCAILGALFFLLGAL